MSKAKPILIYLLCLVLLILPMAMFNFDAPAPGPGQSDIVAAPVVQPVPAIVVQPECAVASYLCMAQGTRNLQLNDLGISLAYGQHLQFSDDGSYTLFYIMNGKRASYSVTYYPKADGASVLTDSL